MLKIILFAIPISCFVLALFLGIMNLTYVLQGKKIPKVISLTHGAFAVTGLSFLIIVSSVYLNILWFCVLLFSLTALGGLYLFSYDLNKKKIPRNFALLHGTLASLSLFIFIVTLYLNFKVS